MTSTPTETSRPTAARRKRLFALLATVAILAYATDQVSKAIALDVLADGESRPLLGSFLSFRLIGNPGAALSLGANNTWIMTGIALAVLVAIILVARQLGSWAWALALGLLLGSAVGNLTDRFVRPPGGGQGHVVDFINYNQWFIGNVADIWIVSAAILIVILAMVGIGVDGRREHRSHGDVDAPEPAEAAPARVPTQTIADGTDDATVTVRDHATADLADEATVTAPDGATVTAPDHATVTAPDDAKDGAPRAATSHVTPDASGAAPGERDDA
ncbi:signal peptidase II [Intrasporangium mesophilum]